MSVNFFKFLIFIFYFLDEENEIENKEFKEKTRKKRKLNQDVVPETEILQEKSRVYAYYFRKPFSIVLEKKNLEEDFNIIDLFTNNPDIINEIERIIIFKVEVAPSDFFLSQIQKNVILKIFINSRLIKVNIFTKFILNRFLDVMKS